VTLSSVTLKGESQGKELNKFEFAPHIDLPPLRTRTEDIPALARHIVARLCARLQIETKVLANDFITHLQSHRWMGNVRELHQLLEEVCARAYQHQTLFAHHLPGQIRINLAQNELQKNQ
jgi:DNA-binding NtrC family response regulator